MKRFCFLPTSRFSSRQLRYSYIRQTPGCSGQWKDIVSVDNEREAEFFVLLGVPSRTIKYPERTIYIPREPKYITSYDGSQDGIAYTCRIEDHGFGVRWWIDYTFDDLCNMEPPVKNKFMSCVMSGKRNTKMQKARYDFVRSMCDQHNKDFDLFGEISLVPEFQGLAQGRIGQKSRHAPSLLPAKDNGLMAYRYSLCVENGRQDGYFTEKITDALLLWAVPVYDGCPNLEDYFPNSSFIGMNVYNNLPDDIYHKIKHDRYETRVSGIREARDLILNRYNIWNLVYEGIKEIEK